MEKRQTYAMFVIVTLACALGSLSQTVMNSMLDGVHQSFGTDEATGQWLTTIYMLTIGMTVPIVSHISKKLEMRSIILLSLAFLVAGSVVSAAASAFPVLIAGRVLQAIGTGITLPIMQTIAMVRFPKGQNATAMGISGIAMGFAPNIGPLIGGALVGTLGWRSFFWMFVGAIAILVVATLLLVKREEAPVADSSLDFPSFLLSVLGFGGVLLGFSNVSSLGLADPSVWVEMLIGVVCIVAFIVRQGRCAHPLISMRIFSSRRYVVAFIAQNCLFASFMGITLILPLFIVNVSGLDSLYSGLAFLPATIIAVAFNPLAGILCDKVGARPVIVCAAAFLSVGAVSMALIDESTPFWLVTLLQSIRAIGVSSLIGPLNSWGLGEMPHEVMVDATSFFTAARQACASFGTALMMIAITLIGASGASVAAGYHVAFGISGLCALVVLVCAVLFVRSGKSSE